MNSIYLFKQLLMSFPESPIPEEPIDGYVDRSNIKSERPCVESIRFAKKIPYERNNHIYIVATEHRRRGWDIEMSEKDCLRVNEHAFDRRLKKSDVLATVRSAFRGDYCHRCDNEILEQHCIGIENCNWVKEVFRRKDYETKDHKEGVFEENWLGLLRLPETAVYQQLRQIEKIRGLPPGSILTLSQRELSQRMKMKDKGVVARAIKKLESHRLVEIVFQGLGGNPQSTGFASEIKRVIPIPMPGGRNE